MEYPSATQGTSGTHEGTHERAAAAHRLLGFGRRGGRRRATRGDLERVLQTSRASRAGPHRPEAVASWSIGRCCGGSLVSARAGAPAARGSRRDARRLGHAFGARRRRRGEIPQARRRRGRDRGEVGGGDLYLHSLHRADLPRRGAERLPDDGPADTRARRGPRRPREHVNVGRTGRGQLPRDQRRGRRHPVRLVRQPAVVQGHLPRVQQPGCAVPVADYQRRASHRARGRRALPLRHTGRHQDAQALQRAARFAQGREGGARVHGVCRRRGHRPDGGHRGGVRTHRGDGRRRRAAAHRRPVLRGRVPAEVGHLRAPGGGGHGPSALPLCRGQPRRDHERPRVAGVPHAVPIAAQVQRERVARVVEFRRRSGSRHRVQQLRAVEGSRRVRRGGRAADQVAREGSEKGESSDYPVDHRRVPRAVVQLQSRAL